MKKSPLDPAPDWVDQTYGIRASYAIYLLTLLGFLTEEEAVTVNERFEKWIDSAL